MFTVGGAGGGTGEGSAQPGAADLQLKTKFRDQFVTRNIHHGDLNKNL